MNRNLVTKLAFALTLATIMFIGITSAGSAVPRITIIDGSNNCPAAACPADLAGFNPTGATCERTEAHGTCIAQCRIYSNGYGQSCYANCAYY